MNSTRFARHAALLAIIVCFVSTALATEPQDFRFPREPGMTDDGYPLPLSGAVMTRTPIVIKDKSANLRTFPKVYYPGEEVLAGPSSADGWSPAPVC